MNIFHVLLILSVPALTDGFAAKVTRYDNLFVVTSMDVTHPDPDNPKRVEFSSRLSTKEMKKYADDKGKHEARLITNVEFMEKEKKFQADEVDVSKLKAFDKKPLFCLHGIDNAPDFHLDECSAHKDKFEKHEVIPVIWPIFKQSIFEKIVPNKSGPKFFTEFQLDKDAAKAAALAFKEYMNKHAGQISEKSVMAHSMGNRVLRYTCADNNSKFDHIFMCAAAVPRKMFSKDGAKDKNGLALVKTLKNSDSKIHVLYNTKDRVLRVNPGSKVFKNPIKAITGWTSKKRLGAYGYDEENLHPDLEGKIENIDCQEKWLKDKLKTPDSMVGHGYQWDQQAIQIYEDTC